MHSIIVRHVRSLAALVACAALSVFTASTASAAVTWHNVQFGGFFSQGYLNSTNNNYPVDTKDGTFDFREEALNASTTWGTHLRVGAQVFAQKIGKYGDDKPMLDWAIVDYNFCPQVGVQVGRLKFPRGLNSDVLDLDMVRPFILLPQPNYDVRLRDFQKSFDGAMIYGSLSAGKSTFDYKLFYGELPMNTDAGVGDFWNNTGIFANPPGIDHLAADKVYGAALMWSTPISGLRFGANFSRLPAVDGSGPFLAAPMFPASISFKNFDYYNTSVEYTRGPWTFTGEYLFLTTTSFVTLPAILGQPTATGPYGSRAYYVTVARRLGERFEVGAYYTHTSLTYPAAPGPQNHRGDFTTAVRFDVNEHLLFKLEVHVINGTEDIFNVVGIENAPGNLKDSMLLFAAKTTLSF